MGFNLIWSQEQIDKAAEDFSNQLAVNLENSLEDKQRQIKWCRSMSDLSTRVHKMFNLDGLTVAEIRFSSMSAEYRALSVVLPAEKVLFCYSTVPKGGSQQQIKLKLMRENSDIVRDYFSKKY